MLEFGNRRWSSLSCETALHRESPLEFEASVRRFPPLDTDKLTGQLHRRCNNRGRLQQHNRVSLPLGGTTTNLFNVVVALFTLGSPPVHYHHRLHSTHVRSIVAPLCRRDSATGQFSFRALCPHTLPTRHLH